MTYNDCTINLMYNHNQYYTSISYFKQQKRVGVKIVQFNLEQTLANTEHNNC